MNRRGFTLIEVILVIVIMLMLSIILVPNVLSLYNKNNVESCMALRRNIIDATKLYVADNRLTLGFSCDNTINITLDTLVNYGKLSTPITNPVTHKEIALTNYVTVSYSCSKKSFDYKFDLSCEK